MIRRASAIVMCALLAACAARPAQQSVLPAAPPLGEPGGLVGLGAQALRVSFGAPALVRKDGTAEIWRYDGRTCRAFFFLYPQGGGLVVRHVETLPRGALIAADTTCLDALRAAPAKIS